MHSDIEKRSKWYYLLATIAFGVVVLAIVQMVQLSGTALASEPSLKGALAQAKGFSKGSTYPSATGTPWAQVGLPLGTQAAPQATAAVGALHEGFEDGDMVFTQFRREVATCVPGGCGWAEVTT